MGHTRVLRVFFWAMRTRWLGQRDGDGVSTHGRGPRCCTWWRGCWWWGASPDWRWWLRGAWAGTPPNPALTPGTELVRLSTGCEHEAGRIWPMDVPRGTEEMLRAGLGCCEVPGTPAQSGSHGDGHLPAQGTCWGRIEPPLPGPISPGCSEGRGRAGRGRGKNNNNKKKGATPSPSPEALLWTLQIRFSEKEMFYRP